jgi:hypothetical protein
MNHIESTCFELIPFIIQYKDVINNEIHDIEIIYMKVSFTIIDDIKVPKIRIKYKDDDDVTYYHSHDYDYDTNIIPLIVYEYISYKCANLADMVRQIIGFMKHIANIDGLKERDLKAIKYIERYIAGDMKRIYNGFHDISIKTE